MNKVRPEVEMLLRDRINFEGCDEGAAGSFARCRQFELKRKDRRIPSLHISWRQALTILDLNTDESRLLVAAGFDVKAGSDYPYVNVLERRLRHRHLAYGRGGWCISTLPLGQNIDSLVSCPQTIIPTISMDKTVEMIVGLHDAFRTLKEELKLHCILSEFLGQQEKIFSILAALEEDARREILGASETRASTLAPMGRAVMTGPQKP